MGKFRRLATLKDNIVKVVSLVIEEELKIGSGGKQKQSTPAQRLGVADRCYSIENIVYFKSALLAIIIANFKLVEFN